MKAWLCLCLMLLLATLGSSQPPREPTVDLAAERGALMDADRAWSQTVDDPEEFLSFFADGASFMPFGAPLARGDTIRNIWKQLSSMPAFHLEWQPTSAVVAEAGDLGYTIGTFELTAEQDGTLAMTVGKYVTVWGKQTDGSWKVLVDCFHADGPPREG
jgi:ketosteroid isomerase-like protein